MQKLTYQTYWKGVQSLGESILEECKEHGQDVRDMLHETIDGDSWIIYTFYHDQIQEFSDNWEHGLDEGLIQWEVGQSFSELTMALSFWALNQDVSEWLYATGKERLEEELEELETKIEKLENDVAHFSGFPDDDARDTLEKLEEEKEKIETILEEL